MGATKERDKEAGPSLEEVEGDEKRVFAPSLSPSLSLSVRLV